MSTVAVSPVRVRQLLTRALDLFSKGSMDGRFWVQGTEVTNSPILGSRYGYCSIGAINHVEGFTPEEREAARIALARMIVRDSYSNYTEEDVKNDVRSADDAIVEFNDEEETTFSLVREYFSAAMRLFKK